MADFTERTKANYVDKNGKFIQRFRNYSRQYANIYSSRLAQSRDNLENAARKRFGEDIAIKRLSELVAGERCVVVGTLFKQMVNKPNILREISEEHQLEPQPIKEKFTDISDVVILEDEIQRIVLKGEIEADDCVTGVTVAVVGKQEEKSGRFEVEEMVYRSMEEVEEKIEGCVEDVYVLFVSGVEVGGANDVHLFELQLLFDMVNGALLGGEGGNIGRVVRVVVAGNSFANGLVEREGLSHGRQKKGQMREEEMLVKTALKQFDHLIYQLAINTSVDIIPGPNDPTSFALPQKPLHPCLFPFSSTLSSVHYCPNPYNCSINGCEILGTSGQATKDIASISNITDPLSILQHTLTFGHLAPSCPDTVACYPYEDHDPFFIRHTPHIYFTANQPHFSFKHCVSEHGHKSLLLSIPVFRTTKTAVLVNLRKLHCEAVKVLL